MDFKKHVLEIGPYKSHHPVDLAKRNKDWLVVCVDKIIPKKFIEKFVKDETHNNIVYIEGDVLKLFDTYVPVLGQNIEKNMFDQVYMNYVLTDAGFVKSTRLLKLPFLNNESILHYIFSKRYKKAVMSAVKNCALAMKKGGRLVISGEYMAPPWEGPAMFLKNYLLSDELKKISGFKEVKNSKNLYPSVDEGKEYTKHLSAFIVTKTKES